MVVNQICVLIAKIGILFDKKYMIKTLKIWISYYKLLDLIKIKNYGKIENIFVWQLILCVTLSYTTVLPAPSFCTIFTVNCKLSSVIFPDQKIYLFKQKICIMGPVWVLNNFDETIFTYEKI